MAVTSYELYQIASEYVTADLIIWQRYRKAAPGILEAMLDANPQLAVVHRTTPFIPPGTLVRVPIDPDIISGLKPPTIPNLWTDRAGYTL